jgi:hypothetical protein
LDIIKETYYSYRMMNNSKNFNLKITFNIILFDVGNPSELKEQEEQWKDQFQTSGGYEQLFDIYRTVECREEKLKSIEQHIKKFVFKYNEQIHSLFIQL